KFDLNGKTILHHAIENNLTETVDWLLEEGADVEHEDNSGLSPVGLAFEGWNFEILRLVFRKRKDRVHLEDFSSWLKRPYMINRSVIRFVELADAGIEVEVMNMKELEEYLHSRSFSLDYSCKSLPSGKGSMMEFCGERQ